MDISLKLNNKKQLIDSLFKEAFLFIIAKRKNLIISNETTMHHYLQHFRKICENERILNLLITLRRYDLNTFIHSVDVFVLGTSICETLEITDKNTFKKACLLHDIGKIKIEKKILKKSNSLSNTEKEEIKKHPFYSFSLLNAIKEKEVALLTLHHHEKYNGLGYPLGLKEKNSKAIILSIIDEFSALTLPRHYKKQFEIKKSKELIKKQIFESMSPTLVKKYNFILETISQETKQTIFLNPRII